MGELLKKRMEFAVKLTKFIYNYFNSKVDLKSLQDKFHADRGKITRIDLKDINLSISFRICDGKLELLKNVKNPDNVISTSSDLYFSIFEKDYDSLIKEMINRWRYGELTMTGESAMVDFKLFIRAMKELKEIMPKPEIQVQVQAKDQG